MKLLKPYAFLLLSIAALLSCNKYRVYDKYNDIPQSLWYADSTLTYTFEIADSIYAYHILYNIRYSISYPYHNIYIKYKLYDTQNNELKSDLQFMDLLHPTTGEPLGAGTGDIFNINYYALKNYKFAKSGKYKITLTQYMRQDPLPEILSVGIRVDKSTEMLK
ncbi:MAG: gliding motility lipoprotein GldH [Cytophagales bacterium]|nr:gliding motility lipoprotein GldH [Cytophagales bacterium]